MAWSEYVSAAIYNVILPICTGGGMDISMPAPVQMGRISVFWAQAGKTKGADAYIAGRSS